MDKIAEVAQARTGQVLTFEAPSPHAGWPQKLTILLHWSLTQATPAQG